MSTKEVKAFVEHYKKYLQKYVADTSHADGNKVLHALKRLAKVRMTLEILQESGIGRYVNVFRKNDGEIGSEARKLVGVWKQLVKKKNECSVKSETISETPSSSRSSSRYMSPVVVKSETDDDFIMKTEPSDEDVESAQDAQQCAASFEMLSGRLASMQKSLLTDIKRESETNLQKINQLSNLDIKQERDIDCRSPQQKRKPEIDYSSIDGFTKKPKLSENCQNRKQFDANYVNGAHKDVEFKLVKIKQEPDLHVQNDNDAMDNHSSFDEGDSAFDSMYEYSSRDFDMQSGYEDADGSQTIGDRLNVGCRAARQLPIARLSSINNNCELGNSSGMQKNKEISVKVEPEQSNHRYSKAKDSDRHTSLSGDKHNNSKKHSSSKSSTDHKDKDSGQDRSKKHQNELSLHTKESNYKNSEKLPKSTEVASRKRKSHHMSDSESELTDTSHHRSGRHEADSGTQKNRAVSLAPDAMSSKSNVGKVQFCDELQENNSKDSDEEWNDGNTGGAFLSDLTSYDTALIQKAKKKGHSVGVTSSSGDKPHDSKRGHSHDKDKHHVSRDNKGTRNKSDSHKNIDINNESVKSYDKKTKHNSSKGKNSESMDKSSSVKDKDTSNKDKHSNSKDSHSSSKDKYASSKSDKDKHSSSSKDKHSSSKDKHSSSSKDKHSSSSKDKHSSSSKDKHSSSSKDKSSSSSKDKNSSSSKDKNSSSSKDKHSSSSKDKHGSSSSSKDKHSTSSKDKRSDSKDKGYSSSSKDKHSSSSKDKHSSSSSKDKHSSSKERRSSNKSRSHSHSSSGGSHRSSSSKTQDDTNNKQLTLEIPKPTAELSLSQEQILSTLPDITPDYKPLHLPVIHESAAKALDYCDVGEGFKKNTRTNVFSGRKKTVVLEEVPTLFDSCMKVLMENIDAIDVVGEGVPYYILKPVLERCTPTQLYNIEDLNPHFIGDSDELWEAHCKKDFKGAKPGEWDSWRELYLAKHDEREERLKKLTSSITNKAHTAVPVRKAKLAYVDGPVKPPRGVMRAQAKFGTAGKPWQSGNKYASTSTNKPEPNKRRAEVLREASEAGPGGVQDGGRVDRERVPVPKEAMQAARRNKKVVKTVAPMMAKSLKLLKGLRR